MIGITLMQLLNQAYSLTLQINYLT